MGKTHEHEWSTPAQRQGIIALSRAAQRKIMAPILAEQREWERLRSEAEARLDDADTLVMGRRQVAEVTAVHRLRRYKREWLAGAGRQMSAYECAHWGRR